MKRLLKHLALLLAVLMPTFAAAYDLLIDGVYQDGSTLYISSSVTSIAGLNVNPTTIYSYATTPPTCDGNTFTGYGAAVHVPTTAMAAYFTAPYWYNFANVTADAVEPLEVAISSDTVEIEMGDQLSLNATVIPPYAYPTTVVWSSSDVTVATVIDGVVEAISPGECDIIASCLDKQAVCHVTVTPIKVHIMLDQHALSVLPNHLVTLTATCSPSSADLAVTSSDNTIAMPRIVNGAIQVLGLKEGVAIITVGSADGTAVTDSCQVTVYTEIGDVNCDGFVNMDDLTTLINYLVTSNESLIKAENADVNLSGAVNMDDLTTLINYLVFNKWPWEPEEPETPQTETFTVNGVSFKMVVVEGGTFTMGATPEQGEDAYNNEKPAHQVTLSSYSIGETEVTQALWQAVMGSNPSYFKGNLQRPVERVTWNDCQTFIARLNQLTGKTFRLPTEAEWEFAARGGTKSQGYKYSGSNTISDVAWYYDNSYALGSSSPDYATHAVATKAPNELGLYDMSGNVLEWSQDWYGSYSSDAQTNPMGLSTGSRRVNRGGSWGDNARNSRVSFRFYYEPSYADEYLGLRLALSSDNGPTPQEHEWVDLGLPSGTLWATCNVGATAPEEYGDYFAWGETSPKNEYSWNTYKWCNGSENTLTKYCTDSSYGTVDNKTELEPEDDAAYVNWGPLWRMPSHDQQMELVTECSWQWTIRNGVNGRLVTGPNGTSLFLPVAGSHVNNATYHTDSYGFYWSRSISNSRLDRAYIMYFSSMGVAWDYFDRSDGFTVRAVRVSQN